ncbi:hypothetical protein GGR58DRAFT_508005 [Xylaria digitata]|nr:hypothetical protein GGR58DRAFT_508005 [Xylaria digitata]
MAIVSEKGEAVFIPILIFTPITTLMFVLRFWASWLIKRPLSIDDGFAILTYITATSQTSFFLWALFGGGLGKPSSELSLGETVIILKVLYISSIVWIVGQVFAKLTILFLYHRIFTIKWFQKAAHGVIVFTTVYLFVFLFIFVFHCNPISNLWNPVPGGWCREVPIEEYTSTSISIFIDLIIIVMPAPVLWRLQMTMQKRIALISMFSIGIVTVAIQLWRLGQTADSHIGPTTDLSQAFPVIGLIALLELWLGVIVSSIPTFAPLLNRYLIPWVLKFVRKPTSISQQKLVTLETIGAKRSREKYWRLKGYLDPLASGLGPTNTANCAADEAPADHLELGTVHVREDFEVRSQKG